MNERVGRIVAWFALIMVLVQFTVVLLRYVFGLGFIPMQESILFMHSMLFLLAFPVLLGLQGISMATNGFLVATGRRAPPEAETLEAEAGP